MSARRKPEKKASRICINPLPGDAVGPRLLVKLQAEKIMRKLGLPEEWERRDGWNFGDICAIVACGMGEGYVEGDDRDVAERVRRERDPDLIGRICALAAPPLVEDAGAGNMALPIAYENLLILGLGSPACPIPADRTKTQTARLESALAEVLRDTGDGDVLGPGVPARVSPRTFERAKNNVRKRYLEHMERERRRAARGNVPIPEVRSSSQSVLLRAAMERMARAGLMVHAVPYDRCAVVAAAFRKAGLRHPFSRRE